MQISDTFECTVITVMLDYYVGSLGDAGVESKNTQGLPAVSAGGKASVNMTLVRFCSHLPIGCSALIDFTGFELQCGGLDQFI
jgi:hypothetical protein